MLVLPPQLEKFQKVEKNILAKVQISQEAKAEFQQAKDCLEKWLAQAQEILRRTASSKPYSWEDVDFENEKGITGKVKEGNQAVKKIHDEKRAL